jgi:hypothetical protein
VLYDDGEQDVNAAVQRLEALRKDVSQRPRLVYNTKSVKVLVRNLMVVPSGDFHEANQLHNVAFGFIETGD